MNDLVDEVNPDSEEIVVTDADVRWCCWSNSNDGHVSETTRAPSTDRPTTELE